MYRSVISLAQRRGYWRALLTVASAAGMARTAWKARSNCTSASHQELLKAALEALNIARDTKSLVVAQGNAIIDINARALELCGRSADELVGKNVAELFQDTPQLRSSIERWETELKTASGGLIAVEVVRQPLGTKLAEIEVHAIRDLRDRREAAEERDRQIKALQDRDEELRTQNLWFNMALRNMSQGLCMFDAEQRLMVANDRFAEMYGLPLDLIERGTTLHRILERRVANGFYSGSDPEAYVRSQLVLVDKRYTRIDILRNGRVIAISRECLPDGGYVATHDDVTERHQLERSLELRNEQLRVQEEELRAQNLRFKTALDNMGKGLCMFDGDKRLVVCNDLYAEMYRLPPELLKVGTPHKAVIAHRITNGILKGEKDDGAVGQKLSVLGELPANVTSSRIDELADGRLICVTRQPMPGGGWVATHEDVTEQRRSEAKIMHMAQHDALTDLPNRVLLRERLEQALGRMRDQHLALLILDLDRFKDINDTLGHPAGDILLKTVAKRLTSCVRETDTVARLGGDEFAIIESVTDPANESSALAKRIREVVSTPIDLDGHLVTVGTSIGIATAPGDGTDPDQLMKNADLALYRAKSDGRDTYCFFEPEMDQRMQARRNLERDLRNALVNGEFELHYQPVVNLECNEICAFEALLRWNHPERGRISPADFIPLAEETGLIVPIGEWVLRRACAEAANWPEHLRIAVNISAVQFKNSNLVSSVVSALASSNLAAQRLELEVTESVMLENSEAAFVILNQLHDFGVRLALDDFGTGYSSLSYLRKFPFDKIKIDRSFVNELSEAKQDSLAIVRAVVRLGVSLGIATTAEGVETKEQLERVREEGCTEMQGYYFSQPKPAEEIARLFLARTGKSASAA